MSAISVRGEISRSVSGSEYRRKLTVIILHSLSSDSARCAVPSTTPTRAHRPKLDGTTARLATRSCFKSVTVYSQTPAIPIKKVVHLIHLDRICPIPCVKSRARFLKLVCASKFHLFLPQFLPCHRVIE